MAQAWYDVSEMMTQSPIFKGSMKFAFDALILSVKTFVALLPVLISYLASQGLWSALVFLNNMRKAIWAAVTAQTAFNSACKVNPYVALASVLLTVVGVITSFVNQAKEAAKAEAEAARKANEWKNNLREAQSQTDTATRKLHSYKVAMEKLNLSQAERSRQISQFNRDFRPYISKLGIEIKSVDDLRKNYKALAEEIQRATYYRLREKAKEEAMPKFQRDRLNAENRVRKALEYFQSRGSGFTAKGVMEMFAKGANANWIYQQIVKGDIPNVDKNGIAFDVKQDAILIKTQMVKKFAVAVIRFCYRLCAIIRTLLFVSVIKKRK